MQRLGVLEDVLAANEVLAPLDTAAVDEIDLAREHPFELRLHTHEIEQRRPGSRTERYEHVDVAIQTEVIAQDRAKERELHNTPPPAELGDLIDRQISSLRDHARLLRRPILVSYIGCVPDAQVRVTS